MVEVLCQHVSDESPTVRRLCLRGLVQVHKFLIRNSAIKLIVCAISYWFCCPNSNCWKHKAMNGHFLQGMNIHLHIHAFFTFLETYRNELPQKIIISNFMDFIKCSGFCIVGESDSWKNFGLQLPSIHILLYTAQVLGVILALLDDSDESVQLTAVSCLLMVNILWLSILIIYWIIPNTLSLWNGTQIHLFNSPFSLHA